MRSIEKIIDEIQTYRIEQHYQTRDLINLLRIVGELAEHIKSQTAIRQSSDLVAIKNRTGAWRG